MMWKSWIITDAMPAKRLNPIPPGEILREDFLRPMGLTHAALAAAMDVSQGRISEIVHGRTRVSAELALRLGKALGTSADLWLGLQIEYDLRLARLVKGAEIDRRVRLIAAE